MRRIIFVKVILFKRFFALHDVESDFNGFYRRVGRRHVIDKGAAVNAGRTRRGETGRTLGADLSIESEKNQQERPKAGKREA